MSVSGIIDRRRRDAFAANSLHAPDHEVFIGVGGSDFSAGCCAGFELGEKEDLSDRVTNGSLQEN
jgi:hypothetical protein